MSRSRTTASVVVAAMVLSATLACSSGGAQQEPTVNADGSTPMEMWIFGELHGALYEQMADRWNELNPDRQIDLELTVYPYQDMHNKLQLAANSGAGMPDLADIEVTKFANFVRGDNPPLMDLSQAAEPYRDDIVEARLELYSRDDALYGYPTHVGAFVTFYNTELLEAAGIDYTTIETWDDFAAAGAEYSAATGKAFGTANTDVFFVEPLVIAQNGGSLFAEDGTVQVDSAEVVSSMEMMQDMVESGAISPIPGSSPDDEEAYGAIGRGDFAAIVYPAWYTSRFVDYMPDLAGKIAIAPAPVVAGSDTATIGGGGTGTAVSASSPVKDLAAEWLAFAKLSPEANVAVWEILGFDPVNMSVWDDDAVTKNPDNAFNQYFTTNLFDVLNEVKDGIGHFDSFSSPDLPPVNSRFGTVTLAEIYEGGVPAREALEQAQQELQNELRQG
ncbi:ABC transporter substrate-binding protein [Cellulomonas hominis]|uniref:Arabinosaccharide transport system substrate-binding protein n=1 Tax=Cellulomonas hominis TaxID=156981 RepID=A0A7W8SEH2_9CELL|nr:extracellular solute-binding protein [Cellulomonas hominis]MBB5472794.1 arabinosaccharide transport system substrate-binding protein [Cellulomonas hominis]NKY06028.1 extracellular solute-binding protein [Cellulomonas hominis]NKY10048.1 extracellular solute-binding protein [Cellulomonas hominis]